MPPTFRVRPPLHRLHEGDDSGFTVIEALVSFVVLTVVSAATVVAIINFTKTSKTTTDRAAATNIAQQDLQAARAMRFPAYPQPRAATATVVDNTTFTATRSVVVRTASGSTAGSCPTTPDFTNQPYMIVTSTVTWPSVGSTDKVTLATELAC